MRPNFLDYSKAIGILLVIIGHLPYVYGMQFQNIPIWNVAHAVTLFHMPLFFIISGVLFKPCEYKLLIKKNINQLLIPYVLLSIIVLIIGSVLDFALGNFSIHKLLSQSIGVITIYDLYGIGSYSYCSPLWFCVALFFVKIIANGVIYRKNRLCLIILLCLLGGGTMYISNVIPLRIDSAIVGFIFFIIGYLFKDKINRIDGFQIKTLLLLTFISGAFLCLMAYFNLDFNNKQCLSITANYYGSYPILFLFSGICGSILIFSISEICSKFKSKIVLITSNGTIIILAFHKLILKGLSNTCDVDNVLSLITISAITLMLCLPLILFSGKYLPILVGKRTINQQ